MVTVMKRQNIKINQKDRLIYRNLLIEEMKKLGAENRDYDLISDELIQNALLQNWKAEDVAWAILQ